jgi:hypothetical protein
MATPARALTNNYQDCRLIKLDPNDPKSPVVIVQEGYAHGDLTFRMALYYLQRDGLWIDEIARSSVSDKEVEAIIFDNSGEALKVLGTLIGKPMVRTLPIKEADVQAYIAKAKSVGSAEVYLQDLLKRYRASQGRP